MNILFITIGRLADIHASGIYTDLLKKFHSEGNQVYVLCALEKRLGLDTVYTEEEGYHFLRVRIGNITKSSIVEKGISTVMLERQYISALKRYLKNVRFDLVLYTTPPITCLGAVKYIKQRDQAKTYLLLKDIFPQNAVDIGMLAKTGVRGLLYKYFRSKEKKLYALSDRIGCMSQANVDYVIQHNPEVDPKIVEICPNSIEVIDKSVDQATRIAIREKYGIPLDKTVFVYGGNLGKPQGINFLIECMKSQKGNDRVFFLIVGDGTEYGKLEAYVNQSMQSNLKLMKRLPKEDYDTMVGACDVGMIFLDHRFTIPNFPSRLLSYMQAKVPVLACTDPNTDIGKVIVEGGFGWWCESDDVNAFGSCVEQALTSEATQTAEWEYLNNQYSVAHGYETIMRHWN